MASRNYSSIASEKQLASNVSNIATQVTLDNATNLPTPPFILVLNPDTSIEEIVLVNEDQTGVTSPTFKVTRAQDGTTAQTHTAGQIVRHMIVGSDLQLKAPLDSPTFTGTVVLPSTTSIGNVSSTELNYVNNVTSNIQAQLDSKYNKMLDVVAAKTSDYTILDGDQGKLIQLDGTFNLLIPTDATFNFAIGTTVDLLNIGTGVITIAAVDSATTVVNGTPVLTMSNRWSSVTLIKRAANTWVAIGNLS